MANNILIIDGDALMHITYNGSKKTPSYSEDGIPNYLIKGFIYSYSKLIKDLDVADTVFVFDSKEKTFRHELADGYKKDRREKDIEMIIQESIIYDIIDKSGFKKVIVDGYEGDDVVASIALEAGKIESGYDNVYIATSDKDIYQILGGKIKVWNLMKKAIVDDKNYLDFFPVEPKKVVSYLCLVGDSADCVKGVDGIGAVGAAKLLQHFDDFISIFDNINEVHHKDIGISKKAWDELVRIQMSSDPIIEHNVKMITLVTDVEVSGGFKTDESLNGFDAIYESLLDLGFKTTFDRFYGRHK